MTEVPTTGRGYVMRLDGVLAEGDERLAAAARGLAGMQVTVSDKGVADFNGRAVSHPLSPADEVLLSELLVAPTGSRATATFRPDGAEPLELAVVRKTGSETTARGVPAKTMTADAGGSTSMALTAYRASAGPKAYVAEPAFRELVGAVPDQPFATTSTSRTVTKRVPYTVTTPGTPARTTGGSSEGIVDGFFRVFTCILTFLLLCPDSPPSTPGATTPGTPARTETRYRNTTEVVRDTVVVKGPDTLDVRLPGTVSLASSAVVARNGVLLEASTTGRSTFAGALPTGTGVPEPLAGARVEVLAEWKMSRTLTSEPPPTPGRGWQAPALALALLATVSGALAATARRRLA